MMRLSIKENLLVKGDVIKGLDGKWFYLLLYCITVRTLMVKLLTFFSGCHFRLSQIIK